MNNRLISLLCCLLPSASLAACGGAEEFTPPGATSGHGGAPSKTVDDGTGGTPVAETGGGAGKGAPAPAPTATATGSEFTFTTGHVSVAPGSEVYKCQDFTNPFGKDIGIVEEVTTLTAGSHHMFAFVMPNAQLTLKDNLVDCPGGGIEFHDYLTTSGSPLATTTYPADTGRIFSAGNGLRLMVHYINTGTEAKDAYVAYKVTYVDPAGLTNKVASIFLDQVGLRVPPGMSTQSKTYTLAEDINMMGAASHMHKRGIHFVATTDSGQTLYDGTDWQEPKEKRFDPPLHLATGTKITWACTYNNDTGQSLTFGESAASNEMCIFPGEFSNATGQQISYQAIF